MTGGKATTSGLMWGAFVLLDEAGKRRGPLRPHRAEKLRAVIGLDGDLPDIDAAADQVFDQTKTMPVATSLAVYS